MGPAQTWRKASSAACVVLRLAHTIISLENISVPMQLRWRGVRAQAAKPMEISLLWLWVRLFQPHCRLSGLGTGNEMWREHTRGEQRLAKAQSGARDVQVSILQEASIKSEKSDVRKALSLVAWHHIVYQ